LRRKRVPSSVIARADALMQRRRQSLPDTDDVPVLTDAIDPDDVPILLDAESPATEPVARNAADIIAEPANGLALEGAMLDIVAHELARRVNERLAAELPGIIETTIRDFLAEPEILALIQPRD